MNLDYTVVNAEGFVLGAGSCPACDVPSSGGGVTVVRGVRPPGSPDRRWGWDGQAFVDRGARVSVNRAGVARAKRNALLGASDWTQLPDVAEAVRARWAPYRQALRDLTAQPGFPTAITWPTAP
jgi:Phage tail assembly chaperone protein